MHAYIVQTSDVERARNFAVLNEKAFLLQNAYRFQERLCVSLKASVCLAIRAIVCIADVVTCVRLDCAALPPTTCVNIARLMAEQ